MTERQEMRVMDRFKELFQNIPNGRVDKMKPNWTDFVLTLTDGDKIGIELTELIEDPEVQRDYSTRNKITDLLLQKLISSFPHKFTLEVRLLPIGVRKADMQKTIDELFVFCMTEFLSIREHEYVKFENVEIDLSTIEPVFYNWYMLRNYRNLPRGIKSIAMQRINSGLESWNPMGGGLTVRDLVLKDLQPIISAKESKLKNYERCSEYWLLIWEGNLPSGYFENIAIDTPIESKFDKVFILRDAKNQIVSLKG